MNYKIVSVIGLIGIGAVLGATLSGTEKATQIPQNPAVTLNGSMSNASNEITSPISNTLADNADLKDMQLALTNLQKQIQQEIEKRTQLEKKVALLEQNNKPDSPEEKSDSSESSDDATPDPHQPGSFGQNRNWFNQQAMLDAGVDPGKVSEIKNTFEQAEMDRLYLRDQATREGWINSDRYTNAVKEIDDRTSNLRSQLNEREYDSYLYAAGRPNRVLVESVLSTSPASNAGIQAGDTILKYDNKRVFGWTDLTSATSGGNPNETVTVTITRDGQVQQLYIPRGPMGIRLTTDSVAP